MNRKELESKLKSLKQDLNELRRQEMMTDDFEELAELNMAIMYILEEILYTENLLKVKKWTKRGFRLHKRGL